ncbi:acetoacetate--CoA ligase [Pseudonocardia xishanensis]|uniref:Acetoacetate--CoA ligase n=1 Tax=Pseudonocardia xishanensis TaxID=630995 RepID=A0ABP8REU8_9PSEU
MDDGDHELLWSPTDATREAARITAFMEWLRRECGVGFEHYRDLWEWSVADLEAFWGSVASFFGATFATLPDRVLGDRTMPGATWFPGARLNYADHVLAADGDGPALVAVHEGGGVEEWGRDRLRDEVRGLAAYLREQGVEPGDRVVACLPNGPEAVVAFLATVSLGAVWAICGPEYGVAAITARFAQLKPAILVVGTGHTYNGRLHGRVAEMRELRAALPTVRAFVAVGEGLDEASPWQEAVATPGVLEPVPVAFDHPLWVLFSSGTTGVPKGIVHGHGGIVLEHLKFLGLHVDLGPRDRFFWHTSTSWMMWTIVVSGLLTGATVVLYDGSPTVRGEDRLWPIVAEQGVTVFGTSAAYLHGCMQAGLTPARELPLGGLRALHSTGSPLSADGFRWAHDQVGGHVPVVSGSGGTDVASGFVGGCPLLPVRLGEIPGPCLGVDVHAWNDLGETVVGEVGELVVTSPMPSMPLFFWNDPDGARYRSSYFDTFPGVWRHGDWIEFTEQGGAVIHGRSDATLNRQGVRMGTAEIYRAVEAFPEITEALVVGVEEPDGGYWLPLFVVMRPGWVLDDALRLRLAEAIRRDASPRHVPDDIVAVPGIPHTMTGKKLEIPVKRLLQGRAPAVEPDAVDDPELLTAFARLRRRPRV